MTNDYLDKVWVERVDRLAIGMQVVDGTRQRSGVVDVKVAREDVAVPHAIAPNSGRAPDQGIGLPQLTMSRSGRFAVRYPMPRKSPATFRIYDDARRFAPRRLQIAFPLLAAARAEDLANREPPFPPVQLRGRRIALFPGSAYGLSGATAIRATVIDAQGEPVRWVRAWATTPGTNDVEGVGHGDERGEVVVVLQATDAILDEDPMVDRDVELHIARPPAVSASPAAPASLDPLATLPVEVLPPNGAPDDVSPGDRLPPGYQETGAPTTVTCRLGRVSTPAPIQLP